MGGAIPILTRRMGEPMYGILSSSRFCGASERLVQHILYQTLRPILWRLFSGKYTSLCVRRGCHKAELGLWLGWDYLLFSVRLTHSYTCCEAHSHYASYRLRGSLCVEWRSHSHYCEAHSHLSYHSLPLLWGSLTWTITNLWKACLWIN